MSTHNHLANSHYVAAYQAQVTADLRDARRSSGRLEAVWSRVKLELGRSMARMGKGNGLEADTRQIRNFDQSESSGACEVRQGLRLAT